MVGSYTAVGHYDPKTHVHQLIRLVDDPDGYLWRCQLCEAKLKRKSGVVCAPKGGGGK